jgi:hypothetical protein
MKKFPKTSGIEKILWFKENKKLQEKTVKTIETGSVYYDTICTTYIEDQEALETAITLNESSEFDSGIYIS